MDDILVKCPNCGIQGSRSACVYVHDGLEQHAGTLHGILQSLQPDRIHGGEHSAVLYPDVYQAAAEVDAGMGRKVE